MQMNMIIIISMIMTHMSRCCRCHHNTTNANNNYSKLNNDHFITDIYVADTRTRSKTSTVTTTTNKNQSIVIEMSFSNIRTSSYLMLEGVIEKLVSCFSFFDKLNFKLYRKKADTIQGHIDGRQNRRTQFFS